MANVMKELRGVKYTSIEELTEEQNTEAAVFEKVWQYVHSLEVSFGRTLEECWVYGETISTANKPSDGEFEVAVNYANWIDATGNTTRKIMKAWKYR